MTHIRLALHLPLDRDISDILRQVLPHAQELRHIFEPHGLSVVRVSICGTLVLHTWPEHKLATLDAYGVDDIEQCLAQHGLVATPFDPLEHLCTA